MTPFVELQNVEEVVVGSSVSASRMASASKSIRLLDILFGIFDKNGHNGLKIQ